MAEARASGDVEKYANVVRSPAADVCKVSAAKERDEDISSGRDPFQVCFDIPFDALNPKDWPRRKKWAVTAVLSSTGLNRIMVSTIMAPALSTIASELHMSNTESVMAMSAYLLATAFGPLVIAPLSEVYGRSFVLHATNIWFLVWNLICGFANSKALLVASRFLAGLGASAVYVLAYAVLGDVWRPEERGKSLGIYALVPLLGAAVGPIIGGFISENTTWRWMFWSTSALQGVMIVASLYVFEETYAQTLLQRKAAKLRKETGDDRYYIEGQDRTTRATLQRSLSRPMRLLLFHPIVQMQALLSGFYYGITYLVLSTFSELWVSQYNESISISGLHYIAMCLGEVVGAQVGGILLDTIYRRAKQRSPSGDVAPEHRVFAMAPGAFFGAAGLFLYGWAAQNHLFWLIVDVGAALQALGLTFGGQAIQAYIIDSYPKHTSSASAASQLFRSLAAFGFPLFAPTMYERLGYGWANSVLAFVCVGIAILPPLFIWRFGERLREKAKSTD